MLSKPRYNLDPFGDKSESTKKGIVSNSSPVLWVNLKPFHLDGWFQTRFPRNPKNKPFWTILEFI